MPTCIYHKDEFETAPREHVLQNFLGARWVSDSIVCKELQDEFGMTIDVALERCLQPLRNLLGTEGGRGEPGPTLRRLPTAAGEVIDLDPGMNPRLNTPVVRADDQPCGGTRVQLQMGNMAQLEWALHKLKQQRPDLAEKIDQIPREQFENHARHESQRLSSPIGLSISLGGADYFRGALKSCMNLLGVTSSETALNAAFDPVRRFIAFDDGDSSTYIRWMTNGEPLNIPRLGDFDHFIGVVSRDRRVDGVVQFFGAVVHSIRLAENHDGLDIKCGYLVDPTRESEPAENREPSFDDAAIPEFESQAVHQDEAVRVAFQTRLERMLAALYSRMRERIIDEVWDEVIGPPDGRPLTHEDVNKLARSLAERVASRFVRDAH